MSPFVQCLSVRMARCSFHADSDRDEPHSMLCNICKSASRAGVNSFWNRSIQFRSGWDATIRLLRLFSVVYSVFVIMFQFYLSISINDNRHNMLVTYYSCLNDLEALFQSALCHFIFYFFY